MPWALLVWLLCFCLQAALVGVLFYMVTQLSDFEMDYQNNFDTARNCNRWVVPEAVVQIFVFVLSAASGHYIAAAMNAVGVYLVVRRFQKRREYLDPLELWKQLKDAQSAAYWKLGVYLVIFVFSMFRLIEVAVSTLLTPHGRAVAKRLLQEAVGGHIHF